MLAFVLVAGGLAGAHLAHALHGQPAARRARDARGLAALFVAGAVLLAYLGPILSALTRQAGMEERVATELGLERQRAAKLTVIRRGLQLGHYAHETLPVTAATADSAEGKAALALFPIVSADMDIAHFAADQERVVNELMYHDWDRENGDAAYEAYRGIEQELRDMHAGPYADASRQYRETLAAQGARPPRRRGAGRSAGSWARATFPRGSRSGNSSPTPGPSATSAWPRPATTAPSATA